MRQRIQLFIYGDVIGVGFRSWAQNAAREIGIEGWVRNTESGDVEITAEGERDKLIQFIDKCNEGPETSWVERVDSSWGEAKGDLKGFCIR